MGEMSGGVVWEISVGMPRLEKMFAGRCLAWGVVDTTSCSVYIFIVENFPQLKYRKSGISGNEGVFLWKAGHGFKGQTSWVHNSDKKLYILTFFNFTCISSVGCTRGCHPHILVISKIHIHTVSA